MKRTDVTCMLQITFHEGWRGHLWQYEGHLEEAGI